MGQRTFTFAIITRTWSTLPCGIVSITEANKAEVGDQDTIAGTAG